MNSPFEIFSTVVLSASLFFCCFYFVTGAEDFVLDLIAFSKKLKPKIIDPATLRYLESLSQKRIAILVPAWHEGNIIGSMLKGNLNRIRYQNYVFLVGCYPNDSETLQALNQIADWDSRVIPVVNSCPGPTSKGQMLNQLIQYARSHQEALKIDAYLLQDSEDIIDPWSLNLINHKLDWFDFVQIPVFSLGLKSKEIVAGTYVDEFAESHTKDLLVREALGAAIPSAGVGTAFTAAVAERFFNTYGWVFYEKSLTEDYEFGIRNQLLKFRGTFAAYGFWDEVQKHYHYIATREYFPKQWRRSIRQKTRWTVGIALQGWRNLGWPGSLSNRYFLYRDRRGVATNILTFCGYLLAPLCGIVLLSPDVNSTPQLMNLSQILKQILWLNIPFVFHRLVMRSLCVFRVYGFSSVWFLPIRWPIAVFINSMACFNALAQAVVKHFQGKAFHWVKTEHELPEGFGAV